MLQGDIVLYSKKNVGSAFVFYIPCIGSNKPINLENSKEECTEGVRIVQEKERKSPLRKDGVKNILFVDDN